MQMKFESLNVEQVDFCTYIHPRMCQKSTWDSLEAKLCSFHIVDIELGKVYMDFRSVQVRLMHEG